MDNQHSTKQCIACGHERSLSEFKRRTGRRTRSGSRRGLCRSCRQERVSGHVDIANAEESVAYESQLSLQPDAEALLPKGSAALEGEPDENSDSALASPAKKKRKRKRRGRRRKSLEPRPSEIQRVRRPLPAPPPMPKGPDASTLVPNREGIILMRGRTDKGRRWIQETDLETAMVLVRERAAVVVNRHTVRRLYSNRSFRSYILERDHHTCFFCGSPGDTIDHLLPRAKGGHTTPVNCVCACYICNQSKAARSLDEFV
jgi:5-methylcytosine-specific restriction endonuclease McrA